jgi:hypothetical protein
MAQPIAGAAISSCEIVTYDSKIVFGYVRELWTAGAFPDGPYIWRTCLQSAIDANVTAPVQFNAGLLESNSGGIRNAPNRDQDVAAVNVLLTRGGAHGKCNLVSRSPSYLEQLALDQNLNTFAAEVSRARTCDTDSRVRTRTTLEIRHTGNRIGFESLPLRQPWK